MPPMYFGKWSPGVGERPDAFISKPCSSVVLEVKAGEVVVSDVYPTQYTLRFPRVINIRYDKNIGDAFSFKNLKELVEDFG